MSYGCKRQDLFIYDSVFERFYKRESRFTKKIQTRHNRTPKCFYSVSILAGLTKQTLEIKTESGEIEQIEDMEPTFEFLIKPSNEKPDFTADFTYPFSIEF